ncbi:hypothetical protein M758_7G081900, partial [Ceratodon purpureus]
GPGGGGRHIIDTVRGERESENERALPFRWELVMAWLHKAGALLSSLTSFCELPGLGGVLEELEMSRVVVFYFVRLSFEAWIPTMRLILYFLISFVLFFETSEHWLNLI